MKRYSGFTNKTAENLLLDSGAFFKNIEIYEDGTYESFDDAVTAGKLIGATRNGGEFSAVPEVRQIEVDGVAGRAKGLESLDSWEVYLRANVLEIKEDTIKAALCGAEIEEGTDYNKITAKNEIELTDYFDNIAWYGNISGSNKPVIIVVKNALNTDGLTLTTSDKNEATIQMTFYGHYSPDELGKPPFEIHYPNA